MVAAWALSLLAIAGSPESEPSFRQAAKILSTHCVRCHNAEKSRGGLDLSTRGALLAGGATRDAISLDAPEDSFLLARARDGSMPPEKDGRRLTPQEVELLVRWVREGLPWPEGATLPVVPQTPAAAAVPTSPKAQQWPSRNLHRRFRRRLGR